MPTQPHEIEVVIVQGEALDFTIDVPLQYAVAVPPEPQESPLDDGSSFAISFKAKRGDVDAAIRFSTDYASPPLLSLGAFDPAQSKLSLSFQAPAAMIRQIAPGDYVGDLLHDRPRGGPLGVHVSRCAVITLTIEAGTA